MDENEEALSLLRVRDYLAASFKRLNNTIQKSTFVVQYFLRGAAVSGWSRVNHAPYVIVVAADWSLPRVVGRLRRDTELLLILGVDNSSHYSIKR